MNMFKNIFRHKPSKKDSDELDRFIDSKRSNKENTKPKGKKGSNPQDVTATACYHTDVAPKTRRGPKSCPGGVSDGGHTNRSFETVIPRRDVHEYASTRQKRSGHAFSEYGGPSTKMSHITYMEVEVPSDDEDEEVDVQELKRQLKETTRKLRFTSGRLQQMADRKNHYKKELAEAVDAQKRINKAYKTQEEQYRQESQNKDVKIQMLNTALSNSQRQCTSCNQHMYSTSFAQSSFMPSNSYSQPSNSFVQPFPSFSRAGTSSVIPDPQPTQNDVFAPMPTFNSNRFTNEDLDERRVFRHEDHSITSSARDEIDLEDMNY